MPFTVMELLVTGELCVLFEKKSTKWIPALQVWYVWKTMLIIWVSLFSKHFFENTNRCYNCCKYLYLSGKDNCACFCLFFMLCVLAEYWEKHRNWRSIVWLLKTTSWIFQTGISPWKFGSSPHIKIRQSMLDSASYNERSLPTCRCSVKGISRNSFVCVE